MVGVFSRWQESSLGGRSLLLLVGVLSIGSRSLGLAWARARPGPGLAWFGLGQGPAWAWARLGPGPKCLHLDETGMNSLNKCLHLNETGMN